MNAKVNKKMVTKSLRMEEDMAKEIEEIMIAENRTFSNLAAMVLKEYVENWKKEQKKDEQ